MLANDALNNWAQKNMELIVPIPFKLIYANEEKMQTCHWECIHRQSKIFKSHMATAFSNIV